MSDFSEKISKICLLLLVGATVSWSQTPPKAKERVEVINGDSVLLRSKMSNLIQLNFTFGFHHNAGKPVIDATLKRIAQSEGWDLQTITDPNDVTFQEINKYTALCANNISGWNNNQYTDAGRTAIQQYVETEGKGVMGIHASGDGSGGAWPWFNNTFHPVGYDGHASRVTAPAIKEPGSEDHPIMEGILPTGERNTFAEFYRNRTHITESNPDVELLMSTDPDRCSGCYGSQHIHPEGNHIMWALPVGPGYHVFFPWGHDQREQDDYGPVQEWDALFTQIFYYIAGYDSLKIGCMDQSFAEYDATAEVEYPDKAAVCQTVPVVGLERNNLDHYFGAIPSVKFFNTGTHTVRLLDIAGNLVEKQALKGGVEYAADMNNLQGGIYFLRATTSQGKTYTKRYLVK